MSVRLLTSRLINHGRFFLQSYWKRDIHINIFEQNKNKTRNRLPASASVVWSGTKPTVACKNAIHATLNARGSNQIATSVPRTGIFRFGQHARKLFVDNILNRVTTTYSEELRTQATKKLFYGDSAPFFALIGVSLASGAGVLTKEDELEGVCWEIREAADRLQASWSYDDISDTLDTNFNIDKLDIGPPIAKGCAAVVYAASLKGENGDNINANCMDTSLGPKLVASTEPSTSARTPLQQQSFRPELMTPIQNISRFVHNFGSSVDNLYIYNQSSAAAAFAEDLSAPMSNKPESRMDESEKGYDGYTAINDGIQHMQELKNTIPVSLNHYPLALKLMFNYDIQSNAVSILRAMYKETVPARQRYMNEYSEEWERHIQDQTLSLPTHPNIVCMYGFFCDEVRNFPDGHLLYPIAQPQRINPNGYGRNMSLYLLMKRYDYSLRSLLDSHEINTRTKLLLFAQLLEAVAHISRHGIAHRDLKSDNILIELNDDDSPPVLVLSDFGCCLADKVHGLQLPYTSYDTDKGGNAALMAPEIINKQPGPFSVLNYAKSDLWACGAIAYEIFGLNNPFYSTNKELSLNNSDYKEDDLPALNKDCPVIIQQLIHNILNPNPSKRVSPDIAANVMQLYLWAPSNWIKSGGMPNSPEILQWLLSLSTKMMCEGRFPKEESLTFKENSRRTYVEYLLICSFLSRARLRRIRGALTWIQNTV